MCYFSPIYIENTIQRRIQGGRRYLSVTEAPHNTESLRVREKETFLSLRPKCRSGVRTRDPRLSKQAALTTARAHAIKMG